MVLNQSSLSFSCPNKDVENFLRYKAIEFSKRDFSKTHLVFWSTLYETEKYLVGYYTIAPKFFSISKDNVSNSQYKKLSQYGEYDTHSKKCTISAILIGQLGKNYTTGNDTLITGDELLKMTLDKVKNIQTEIGGRYTYLECEERAKAEVKAKKKVRVVLTDEQLDTVFKTFAQGYIKYTIIKRHLYTHFVHIKS